ncbi:MAG: hypothetical protein ACM3PP_06585 [Candidatus Saccharibacteria bacterium]
MTFLKRLLGITTIVVVILIGFFFLITYTPGNQINTGGKPELQFLKMGMGYDKVTDRLGTPSFSFKAGARYAVYFLEDTDFVMINFNDQDQVSNVNYSPSIIYLMMPEDMKSKN